ncbi:hypothetical protein [Pseudomonas sp. COW5]|uniref:hypothetical protein n=1 Tax=Pseudomonas sp. COW5 TaxID=2981253 RepID=UPI0022483830|nr:hypothetical protein [Pseudomonas sp. COW5]MCX2546567.1 hypothetical protein [Pseudomonas sp. COW5]
MALPSFDQAFRQQRAFKPRILVLEIRDRERAEDPAIGWIIVEREEVYQRDQNGKIYEASIRLSYQRITTRASSYENGNGQFNGSYSSHFNAVSLTSSSMSKGSVCLNLPELNGQRIGTYLMNEIVEWAQQWPDATVNAIQLLSGQARGDNKARRNRFYEQFGLSFDYHDSGKREGVSNPMQVQGLSVVETWKKNISEHRIFDYLAEQLSEAESAEAELDTLKRAFGFLLAEQKEAEARPLRWDVRRLYVLHSGAVITGCALAICASLLWFKIS